MAPGGRFRGGTQREYIRALPHGHQYGGWWVGQVGRISLIMAHTISIKIAHKRAHGYPLDGLYLAVPTNNSCKLEFGNFRRQKRSMSNLDFGQSSSIFLGDFGQCVMTKFTHISNLKDISFLKGKANE